MQWDILRYNAHEASKREIDLNDGHEERQEWHNTKRGWEKAFTDSISLAAHIHFYYEEDQNIEYYLYYGIHHFYKIWSAPSGFIKIVFSFFCVRIGWFNCGHFQSQQNPFFSRILWNAYSVAWHCNWFIISSIFFVDVCLLSVGDIPEQHMTRTQEYSQTISNHSIFVFAEAYTW